MFTVVVQLTVALAIVVCNIAAAAELRPAGEEENLIAILQSNQPLDKKDEACVRLKHIATDKSIPALANLLLDTNLSHSGRYALEPMSSPKAEQALIAALKKTGGPIRVGIISSLGVRGDTAAVPELARLLKQTDAATAKAAATALGQIGGIAGLKPLLAELRESKDLKQNLPRDLTDGILRCANSLLAAGKQSEALPVFKELYGSRGAHLPDDVRTAAYAGVIRASGKRGLQLETAGLQGSDSAARLAALRLAFELNLPGTTKTLADLLPKLEPHIQSALIESLQRRNDPEAAPAIAALAGASSAEVRLAVINALRDLGNARQVPTLTKLAADSHGEEQMAARQALVDLRHGEVTQMLLRLLETGESDLQAEAGRALGQRGDRSAVPRLLQLAQDSHSAARKAAIKALASLASEAEIQAMIKVVTEAGNDDLRTAAVEALSTAYQHCQANTGRAPIEPLTDVLLHGDTQARVALLPLCSSLISPEIEMVLRQSVADPDPGIRAAAIRALCDTSDAKLLPDILRIARDFPEENLKTMAIAACVRLATQEESIHLSNKEKLQTLQPLLESRLSAAQKRQVLAGVAEIPDIAAFQIVEPLTVDSDVQPEAAQAAVKIASGLSGSDARQALPKLKRIAALNLSENTKNLAQQTIKAIETTADYITVWEISGPYFQTGKDFSALFDVSFAPENEMGRSNLSAQGSDEKSAGAPTRSSDTTQVNWKTWESSAVSQKPWIIDLLKAIGGEQRVAYAKTWVHSEETQPARLELGSDDGLKVWVSGKLVHAHNVARPLTEGSDVVQITLNQGWNELLLKITQNNQGWAFCARLLKPDGSHLEGLHVALNPDHTAARAQ